MTVVDGVSDAAREFDARLDELNDVNRKWGHEEWLAAHDEATKRFKEHLRSIEASFGLQLTDLHFEAIFRAAVCAKRDPDAGSAGLEAAFTDLLEDVFLSLD